MRIKAKQRNIVCKYQIVLSTTLQLESGKGHNIDFDPSLTILQIYSQQQKLQFIFAFLTCQTSVCTAREPSAHGKIKSKEKLHNVCLKVGFFSSKGVSSCPQQEPAEGRKK